MITSLLLLDVAPEPVSGPIIGIAGLILIAVMVVMLTAAAITGFVFTLRWLMRRGLKTTLPADQTASKSAPQFQPSSPNQP